MKHIKDIEKAYDLLKEWSNVASSLANDGIVMVKEMERLQVETRRLIEEEEWK